MGQFTKDLETTNTSVHCSQNFKMLFAKFSLVALAVVPCLMAATIANEAPEAKELEELFAQSRSAYNIDDLMNEIPDEERGTGNGRKEAHGPIRFYDEQGGC